MWILDNPNLPTVAEDPDIGIAIATVNTDAGAIPLWELELPPSSSLTVPEFSGSSFSVELPQAQDIEAVTGFTPAVDPNSPQPGEFVWDGATQHLSVYPRPSQITAGFKLSVTGTNVNGGTTISSNFLPNILPSVEAVPTSWVNPALFRIFWGLPIVGNINWTRSLEQHPSGSISLLVLRPGMALVRSRFAKGKELEFAGVGFSVSGFNEKLLNTHEYPGGVYDVSISLTGKWNRADYLKSVSLRGGSTLSSLPTPEPIQDPDCQLNSNLAANKKLPTATYPSNLASRNRVSLQLSGNDWKIKIPKDTPQGTTVSWLSLAQERARQNGTYSFFSSPSAVKFLDISSGNYWSYWVPEIEIAGNGDYIRGDGKFGYAAEYANLKVDGEFSLAKEDNTEDTQGKSDATAEPRWKKREPVIQEYTNGDPKPHVMPANTTVLVDLSLNFDTSGPTKSQEVTQTEDGILISRKITTWGFAYLGRDIYQGEDKEGKQVYRAEASAFWQVVKEQLETFYFDEKTGYLLGSVTTGWQYVRFAQESGNSPNSSFPETVLASLSDDEIEINRGKIYEFRKAAINGQTAYYLEQHLDYYTDIEKAPIVIYKVCNRDGTSRMAYKEDPSYVPSMFVSVEMTHVNTYLYMPHPDNDSELAKSEDYLPKPDLTTGEETLNRRYIKILPSSNNINISERSLGDGTEKMGDRFVEYSSQFTASGPNFKNVAEDTKMTTNNGRPGVATKKPSLEERVEPESSTKELDSKPKNSPKYEYRLLTPGYKTTDLVGGSTSFPNALTLQAALKAAKTDLKIRDAQESVSGSIAVPFNHRIQEFDRMSVRTKFDTYALRVMSAQNSVAIQGSLGGIPEVRSDGGTKLSLGIDRDITVRLEKVNLPSTANDPTNPNENRLLIVQVITKDVALGSLLNNTIPTRRNR